MFLPESVFADFHRGSFALIDRHEIVSHGAVVILSFGAVGIFSQAELATQARRRSFQREHVHNDLLLC